MKRSFTIVIERDPESQWLVGEVVELPGCYTQAPDLPTLETHRKEAHPGLPPDALARGVAPRLRGDLGLSMEEYHRILDEL